MSLLKFISRLPSQSPVVNGQATLPLHWQRAGIDGAPFRGSVPMLREDEFESKTDRVYDARNGTFYTGDPTQNETYVKILDAAQNGWYSILYIDRWREPGDVNHHIYVEWVEAYIEAKER